MWTKNLNVNGGTQPTWQLVVIMILMIVGESVAGFAGCYAPAPDYDACTDVCGNDKGVSEVGVRYCKCGPVVE